MKLLRVLETGRFERLGSNRERQVKVRVISATNADLPAMIRAGTLPRGPLLPAQRDRAARCRRWPSAATTSCRWPSTSSPGNAAGRRRARGAAAPRLAGQRARAARTRSSARCCSAQGERDRRRRARPAGDGRHAARASADDETGPRRDRSGAARAPAACCARPRPSSASAARRCTGAWTSWAFRADAMRRRTTTASRWPASSPRCCSRALLVALGGDGCCSRGCSTACCWRACRRRCCCACRSHRGSRIATSRRS